MSSTITSTAALRTMSSASRPLAASATTLKSDWSAKNSRNPARIRAWSSTIAMRIMGGADLCTHDPTFRMRVEDGCPHDRQAKSVRRAAGVPGDGGDGVHQRRLLLAGGRHARCARHDGNGKAAHPEPGARHPKCRDRPPYLLAERRQRVPQAL